MANKPTNPIVDIRSYLWQPDQPGSDSTDFVYKPGKFYRMFIVKYADGSGQTYRSAEPEIDKTPNKEI